MKRTKLEDTIRVLAQMLHICWTRTVFCRNTTRIDARVKKRKNMTESRNVAIHPISNHPRTILLVDDHDDLRITAKWFLTSFGYVVESVRSAEAALAVFDPEVHDLVITDNSMPGMSGLEMAHVIKLRSVSTPVLMHTGKPPDDQSCIDAVIQKPVHLVTLKEAAERLMAGIAH